MKALETYDWPGNVRELENVIERMVILCENDYITLEDLPEKIIEKGMEAHTLQTIVPEEGFSLNHAVNAYEKQLILNALERTGWVKNRAAKLLKMNRTTLVEKIKKQGIERVSLTN
jgi:DNA-binding NtrC family response regulator